MVLTFYRLESPNDEAVSRAYVARDDDGKRQALVLCWVVGMIPLAGSRWAAYPDAACDLDNDRFQEAAAFALARLNSGLELDGATVEV